MIYFKSNCHPSAIISEGAHLNIAIHLSADRLVAHSLDIAVHRQFSPSGARDVVGEKFWWWDCCCCWLGGSVDKGGRRCRRGRKTKGGSCKGAQRGGGTQCASEVVELHLVLMFLRCDEVRGKGRKATERRRARGSRVWSWVWST